MYSATSGSEGMSDSLPQSSDESDPGGLSPLRVLLVDDGAEASRTFERLSDGMRSGRYLLDRAIASQDGFEDVVADGHDVYVVDHHVGIQSGFDFLSWIQAESRRIPIVFVAGAGDHRTGVTAVRSGASCYVVEDSIDSGFLELSLCHAVEQTDDLLHLGSAGIAVDSGSLTRIQVLVDIAGRLRESATSLSEVVRHPLKSDLPASALESFVSIDRRAHTLLTLANDLYDLSILDAGHLEFDTATFSLRGLVSNVTQTVVAEVGERDVEIVVEVASDVPDAVAGDPGRLRRVIVSFVEAVMARDSTDRVVLGVGVEHRNREAVTLRFDVQSAGSVTDDTHVAGRESNAADVTPAMLLDRCRLGMTVALESVSRMGGRVTVDREAGHAASIEFTIRLAIGEDERELHPTIDESAPAEGLILVIADVIDTRRSIVETIGDAELPYLIVRSVEAWTAAMQVDNESVLPDLVVIDSAVDSFAVCDSFQKIAPSVPVVVVVASGTRGDAARCRERGVRGYLAKPTDPGDLVDVIRSTMRLIASGDTTTLVTRHWLREGRVSLQVLVVDDSTTACFLLTRMLEQRGHSTSQASDGREAIEAIRAGSFDVVLMDVVMPNMDGLEATRQIRDMHVGTDSQPYIIGMSAFSDQDSIDRTLDAGMDGFLAKPILPNDLLVVVEQQKSAELIRVE